MTDRTVNPRKPMAVVVALALVAGISISEGLKAVPVMLGGDAASGLVVAAAGTVAFFSISLIAFVVYAMDRVSDRIAHPIPLFDRLLEASRER
jgi:hypothetical protein